MGLGFRFVSEKHTGKRLLLGKPLSTRKLEGELLRKRVALPIFASDPLSSVAYGPQELLLILTLGAVGGVSTLIFAPWIAAVVVLLLAVVVLSYRKVIKAYPSGGGDYEVAKTNLGQRASLVVACALLIDYVMTVAVSISAGTDNLISAFPALDPLRIEIAVGFVLILLAVNLRGIRESGVAFALPTYIFIASVFVMLGTGFYRMFILGEDLAAPSAGYDVIVEQQLETTPLLLVFLLLRAFASGSAALTGVEAIANGVPAFREPKVKNAQITMSWMGITAITMFAGIVFFGLTTGVKYIESGEEQLTGTDLAQFSAGPQLSVIAQLGIAIFGNGAIMFFILQAATAAVLLLAANTAFNGFPVLSSVLARDSYAPKALLTRGDRLVYSNGMLSLAAAALVMILIFQADVTRLIQLYVLGVFTAFTVGQIGMLRHWKRGLADGSVTPREARSGRIINGFGATMTGIVLVIVTVTKFTEGAWLVFAIAIPLYWVMWNTARYYKTIEMEIALDDSTEFGASGDYAIVLMDKLNKPQMKALDYALSSMHTRLDAVHVGVDPVRAEEFKAEWKKYNVKVPLKIIESPFREFSAPLIEYLEDHRRRKGNERISVYMPKLIVGHWWEHIFHNHRANRMRKRLLYVRGVMVTLVPWRLESAEKFNPFDRKPLPGDARRGDAVRPRVRAHHDRRLARNATYVIAGEDDD
jgi:amino acid transporter